MKKIARFLSTFDERLAMNEPTVTRVPACVIAQLSGEVISLVRWPGRLEFVSLSGEPTEATEEVPVELVPPELRAPNTQLWLVTKRFGPLGDPDTRYETEILPR